MSSPANDTARGSQPGSVPSVQETGYLSRPERRIGYNIAGDQETAGDVIALIEVLGGPAVVVGNSMGAVRRLLLRAAMAPPHRHQVVASMRRPGYAKAFSCTTRTSRDPARARLADRIVRALRAQVVMVPEAGPCPQSRRPDVTTGAVLRFLESVTGRA